MSPTVKRLKTADYIIQLTLILSSVMLISLNYFKPFNTDFIFLCYFVVGGWQLLSVCAHFFYAASRKSKLRRIYLILLAIVLGVVGIGLFINPILFLFGLLIVSPMLAILYLVACYQETKAPSRDEVEKTPEEKITEMEQPLQGNS